MSVVASVLVLLGTVTLLMANEVVDDFFLAGLFSRTCRRVAPPWMHRGIVAMVIGATLIVAGISLLHVEA